ncbi:rhomboid-related protein 1 isoform X2 [Falco peregrinus]|uniref:rhomboid-related protein 1 isoform X2 n=1 Tax=Falco peregrinus TaxID=8954 RepID=UPI002478F9D1|nr:rhomboid-related protein 1 isoform X2 [Falco peregrinus]
MDRSSLLQLIQEQLDPENTGFIGVETFASLVHSHELPLDPAKLDMLVALAQGNDEGQISSKRSSSFKRAIANGQRALPRDVLLDETGLGFYKRFVRYVAYEILPCEMDRRWYFYQHRTCPPPVFMAAVTLTQIIVFLCYGARLNKWVLQTYHPEYMKSPLVYHPGHRARAWRFLTYMFMHVGLEQLGFNALLQLMIGVPLEMVHGILRISFLYLAGVLAGSLTVSITDMRAPLVGGSGGVYALCSAHLANVVMNWAGMRCPYKLLRMVLALVCSEYPAVPPTPGGTQGVGAVVGGGAQHLPALSYSELGGGSCRLAPLLAPTAGLGPPAQLHGPPGRGHRGHQHGADHPAQLRGEPAGPVWLVGAAPLLRHLPPLRRLLEHLCLRPAGGTDPPAAITPPHPTPSTPVFI